MRTFPVLLSAAALASSIGVAQIAHAQSGPSVTGILGAVQRCEPSSAATCTSADAPGGTPHPSGVPDNEIDTTDCDANLYYKLELGIADPSASYILEIWAGTQDCSQLANRQTTATSVCWPVMAEVAFDASTFIADVRVQDIVSGAFTSTHPVSYVPTASPSVCQFPPQTSGTNVTLYAFFVDGGANPVGTVQQYPIVISSNPASGAEDGGHEAGVPVAEPAPGGAGCTVSRRDPCEGVSFLGFGVAAIGVSAFRARKRRGALTRTA